MHRSDVGYCVRATAEHAHSLRFDFPHGALPEPLEAVAASSGYLIQTDVVGNTQVGIGFSGSENTASAQLGL